MFVKIEQETNGYQWAQYMLGDCYYHGHRGTDQDYTKAFEWLAKSSEQENSMAMSSLGICYQKGQGCDQNHTKAAELYEKSANLGLGVAMVNLSKFYQSGTGVVKDVNQAQEWMAKAVAQGYSPNVSKADTIKIIAHLQIIFSREPPSLGRAWSINEIISDPLFAPFFANPANGGRLMKRACVKRVLRAMVRQGKLRTVIHSSSGCLYVKN